MVPDSEFSIKRTVNQQGTSKYEINHREASQTAVVDMLKSKGIDLDNNRFLILQGKNTELTIVIDIY